MVCGLFGGVLKCSTAPNSSPKAFSRSACSSRRCAREAVCLRVDPDRLFACAREVPRRRRGSHSKLGVVLTLNSQRVTFASLGLTVPCRVADSRFTSVASPVDTPGLKGSVVNAFAGVADGFAEHAHRHDAEVVLGAFGQARDRGRDLDEVFAARVPSRAPIGAVSFSVVGEVPYSNSHSSIGAPLGSTSAFRIAEVLLTPVAPWLSTAALLRLRRVPAPAASAPRAATRPLEQRPAAAPALAARLAATPDRSDPCRPLSISTNRFVITVPPDRLHISPSAAPLAAAPPRSVEHRIRAARPTTPRDGAVNGRDAPARRRVSG